MVDGVDQCEKSTLDGFLKTLREMFTRYSQRSASERPNTSDDDQMRPPPIAEARPADTTDVRMMLLSCDNLSCVLEELDPFPRIRMRNADARAKVVASSVDQIRENWSGHKQMDNETSANVASALQEGEDRNILWINLVAETLISMTPSQGKKYVKQVPGTVEGIHLQTLLEVPPRQRKNVCAILKWIALAMRPLSILELTKAIKYTLGAQFTKASLRKALTHCRGLVRQEDKEVVLANQSVHSFLFGRESSLRQSKELGMFVFDESHVHAELANSCVAYLQTSANLNESRQVRLRPDDSIKAKDAAFLRKHPFLEYAIVHWPSHAKKANIEGIDYSAPFFLNDSLRRKRWWQSYWISLRRTFSWKWTTPGNFSLLHVAAFFGIVPLATYLEQQGSLKQLLAAEDHHGMKPIDWATDRSQAEMVKFLLERGEYDNKVLLHAARTGESSWVSMVLNNRDNALRRTSSTSPRPSMSTSPLQSFRKATLSSVSSWSKKFEQRSDDGSSVKSPDLKSYGKATSKTPMHIAAEFGHDAVVKVLMEAGEDFHKATDGGWTALHTAAWYGSEAIVDRLIAAGVHVNVKTNEALTPWYCAVKNPQPTVVEILLRRWRANIEAEDHFGYTPFHMACKSKDVFMMKLLLDNGASVDKRMRVGYTPLHWACIHGHLAVVQELLKRGADVSAKWHQAFTEAGKTIEYGPVGLARLYRHESIAQLMESFGAIDKIDSVDADAIVLPPADLTEDKYDVPELQEALAAEPEHMEADFVHDSDASGSAVMSGGDSDEDSELSESGLASRKESTGDVSEGPQGAHSHELHGLGIDRPAERTVSDLGGFNPVKAEEEHCDNAGSDGAILSNEVGGLVMYEEPQEDHALGGLEVLQALDTESVPDIVAESSPSLDSKATKIAKGWPNLKLDLANALGDRTKGFKFKRASSRDDSTITTTTDIVASPQSTNMAVKSPGEAGDPASSNLDKPSEFNAAAGKATILGRFARRKTSGRDEEGSSSARQGSASKDL